MCAQCGSTLLTHGFHQAVAADKRVDQAKVELEAKVEETREQIVLKNKEIEDVMKQVGAMMWNLVGSVVDTMNADAQRQKESPAREAAPRSQCRAATQLCNSVGGGQT